MLGGVYYDIANRKLRCAYPNLHTLSSKGLELVTDFKDRPKGVNERDAVAITIAQLGEEGWELACSLDTGCL